MDSSGWMRDRLTEGLRWLQHSDSFFERVIVYEERRTSWGSVMSGRDQRNNVLQKAMTLYIDEHCAKQMAASRVAKVRAAARGAAAARARRAALMAVSCVARPRRVAPSSRQVDLMAIKFGDENRRYDDDDDDDDDDADAQANRKTGLGELKHYRVTSSVPSNVDFELEKGLKLRIHTSDDQEGKQGEKNASSFGGSKKVVAFTIRCEGPNAVQRVNGFIERCYTWYKLSLIHI